MRMLLGAAAAALLASCAHTRVPAYAGEDRNVQSGVPSFHGEEEQAQPGRLSITIPGANTIGSWRTRVLLDQGSYRFEGIHSTPAVAASILW